MTAQVDDFLCLWAQLSSCGLPACHHLLLRNEQAAPQICAWYKTINCVIIKYLLLLQMTHRDSLAAV